MPLVLSGIEVDHLELDLSGIVCFEEFIRGRHLTPVSSVLEKQRQENCCKLKASLCYRGRLEGGERRNLSSVRKSREASCG